MHVLRHQPLRLLVTGGLGFIGSHYIRRLLATDPNVQRVVNLDLCTYAANPDALMERMGDERLLSVRGDVCDGVLVGDLLHQERLDTVVHFAAESHVDRSIAGPDAFVRTNVMGTFTLLEAVRRYWLETSTAPTGVRFHHISTDEVYGMLDSDGAPFTEQTPYAPNSPYSASKAGADHLVRAYGHTYGLPVVITHSSNNYGPYQHREKLIPTIMHACRTGQPIPVYGTGGNVRDWIHVEDHCRGIDLVLRQGRAGERYNIGAGQERTNLEVVRTVCRLFDERVPQHAPHERLIHFVSDRPGHDWRYALSTDKIQTELGFEPRWDFSQGLAQMLDDDSNTWAHRP